MEECKWAFDEIKRCITKPSIFSSPQSKKQLYMYLVVFDCAVSAILFRHIRDKEYRPVCYVSKAMVNAETRYSRME